MKIKLAIAALAATTLVSTALTQATLWTANQGGAMSTGGLNRCRLVTLPTAQANTSVAWISYEEQTNTQGESIGAKFTIQPEAADKIELADLLGSYFETGGSVASAPIQPDNDDPNVDNATVLEFRVTDTGSVTVTGKLNGTALDLTNAEKRGNFDPLGQFTPPKIVDFGTRPGSTARRARIVFEYFGVTTGFTILDKL